MSSEDPVELFGVRLVGITAESGHKLLLSVALIVAVVLLQRILRVVVRVSLRGERLARLRFWIRQVIGLVGVLVALIGLVSLWFDDPSRLTTALGLFSAGLAFALQKVVTALAGYVVIMRGKTFSVGDRIVMGGVRGDVMSLGFMQTSIMEMGQPPPVQKAEPAVWVQSRQYTGRIVTVSNARVFDEPVYNYTREFSYLWEELVIPIGHKSDHVRVERLLLDVAQRHTSELQNMSDADRSELARRYLVKSTDVSPRVFYRITDNWLELTVRFIAPIHGTRELKDAMSRDLLRGLDKLGVGIASTTFEVVGLPSVRVQASTLGDGARIDASADEARTRQ
ncbi:MAG: mechanosensitive ion channel family protein [Deltaproteobacteria bacterium]|nr:mechanosensitive ion channel family protein [Deltaproteobacteria bacterium]MDQ3298364.1 mechanosensitive ion channel family protein [Myxococcota bacterium]